MQGFILVWYSSPDPRDFKVHPRLGHVPVDTHNIADQHQFLWIPFFTFQKVSFNISEA